VTKRCDERSDDTCKYIADRYRSKWRTHVQGLTEDNARRGLYIKIETRQFLKGAQKREGDKET
jgi:hypothetical protein